MYQALGTGSTVGPEEGNTYLRNRGSRITNWRPALVTERVQRDRERERQSEGRKEGRGRLYGVPSQLLHSSEV